MMLNLTKPEAECLSRMVEYFLKQDLSTYSAGNNFKWVCQPLLTAMKSKIDSLTNVSEKVSQTKQATASKK